MGYTKPETKRAWRLNNSDKVKNHKKKEYLKHKETILKRNKKNRINRRKLIKIGLLPKEKDYPIRWLNYNKKNAKEISSAYLKGLITAHGNKVKRDSIPAELIEQKRIVIKIKRQIKQLKQTTK